MRIRTEKREFVKLLLAPATVMIIFSLIARIDYPDELQRLHEWDAAAGALVGAVILMMSLPKKSDERSARVRIVLRAMLLAFAAWSVVFGCLTGWHHLQTTWRAASSAH